MTADTGVSGARTLELPKRSALGPVTRRRLRRFLTGLAAIEVAAAAGALVAEDHAWRAFALGVLFPGGGFAYGTDSITLAVIATLASAGAWVVAALLWMLTGNVLAPPVVVFGSALLAAVTAGPQVRPGAVAGVLIALGVTVGLVVLRDAVRRRGQSARARERNTYLAAIPAPEPRIPEFRTSELSADDLAHERWLLDLALQPLDAFEGFDRLDQFSFGALRYQLNFTQYALAMAQRHHTPAFHGYLSAGQRNLIEKMLRHQVWSYWRLENFWGNLGLNPDPIRRQNIMFSGYFGLMLSLYRNASGDRRYDRPGSLELRTPRGRVFSYDHPAITKIVAGQFLDEPSGMWACEPGFSYPMCNAIGAAGVLGADPHHDGTFGADVAGAMRRGLAEEYSSLDGSTVHVRSCRFGFATPGVASGSLLGAWQRANIPLLMRPVDPVAAQRQWEILVREDAARDGGEFLLPRVNFSDRRDLGDLRPSLANFWSWLYADAREFGDPDLATSVLRTAEQTLDPQIHNGARAYARASVHSNAVFALGRFIGGAGYGFTDAVTAALPQVWRDGPLLVDAPYPACLVARAECDRGGLRLVLRPGDGAQRVQLSLGRLAPGAVYGVRGAVEDRVVAAADGTVVLHVDLGDRVEVEVRI